mmetsp:Transcript_49688/g.131062  ORF Transcript_49688/g.131062 Transcript_49688/m.131062 type:complete len:529 (+) Transcript_49688:75-1661(+)
MGCCHSSAAPPPRKPDRPPSDETLTGRISANPCSRARIVRNRSMVERYAVLEEELGQGMSGPVVVAERQSDGMKVALKSLPTVNLSEKRRDALCNEVEIHLRLDHPHVCKLLEVFEDDCAVHLIMELCSGKELYERLACRKRFSEADAAGIARQMLDAIRYCHMHGVCHRDLKLENWVYATPDDDANVKLIDFGFSMFFEGGNPNTKLKSETVDGTLYYLSPEVLGGHYDMRCDLWSTGVIVYMLLSGSPPFKPASDTRDATMEIVSKIRSGEYSFTGPRWIGKSSAAKDFVTSLLQVDPNKRPTPAGAMKHPWLVSETNSGDPEIDIALLKGMRDFSRLNHIKRAALGVIAYSFTSQDLRDLELQFKQLDFHGTGTLTMHEMTEHLTRHLGISQRKAERVFCRMDQSGDMEIHYSEFLAACLEKRLVDQEMWIRDAFQKFDLDNTGFISVDNLRCVLGDTYSGALVHDIIDQVDTKKNGVIDFEEFVQAMKGTSDDVISISDTMSTQAVEVFDRNLQIEDVFMEQTL